ncbi:MAG: hypothetical protein ACLPYS_08445 [Vulcanimicrobiaceae bacterium]
MRLSPGAKQALVEAAAAGNAEGPSALARDILEEWAAKAIAAKTRADVARASAYFREHPDWEDDPSDFFPGVAE